MNVALVVNPGSGSVGDPADVVALLERAGADHVARFDVGEHDAAIASGPDRLVVAGGDGTVGHCARAAADAGIPLGVLAAGTANDFARALELPTDLAAAARIAVDPDARTDSVEVLVEGGERPFVNAASAGLGVIAARHAGGLKSRLGPLAYAVGAGRAALTAHAIDVVVVLDGVQWWSGPAWQVLVSGTGRFGGGSAVGETELDDGLVDVTVVPAGPRTALLKRGYGMRRGTLSAQDDVPHRRARLAHVGIGDGETGFNIDGELVEVEAVDVTVHPRRVDVVVPASAG